MRLAARIFDLRQQGHPILEEIVRVPIRDGHYGQVARYYMRRGEQGELPLTGGKGAIKWD